MKVNETIRMIKEGRMDSLLIQLYREEKLTDSRERCRMVLDGYGKTFGTEEDVLLFSSPGRTEISGNHTDHNHGKVLAGSINLDCLGVAAKNASCQVRIVSETYGQDFTIDLNHLEPSAKKAGTADLVKGILKGFEESGCSVGGFNAYVTSNVISAAGVSSSASFEMLLCSMLNVFFNEGRMDTVAYAHIGKYAENHYWDKASGLLDQMACAVGGLITIDFCEPAVPVVEKIDFDFASQGHSLIIVQTGKGHADLSADYSAVPEEMKRVAAFFGKEVLAQISEEDVIAHLPEIRKAAGDRSVLRALHFFSDNQWAGQEADALERGDMDAFLALVEQSGRSSWELLQDITPTGAVQEQAMAVALTVAERALDGRGACRVHGGGFAGTIQAFVPLDLLESFQSQVESALGAGSCHVLSIRPVGGTVLWG